MNPADARRANAREIFHAIRKAPGSSQTEIVRQTGLDKTTVSTVIQRFEEMGVIVRETRRTASRRGRPTDSISFGPSAGLLIGMSVEFDRISFVSATFDGRPVQFFIRYYDGLIETARDVIVDGIRMLAGIATPELGPLRAVGICVTGPLGHDGRLRHMPQALADLPIVEMVQNVTDLPVFADNDANAAALAEHLFGSNAGANDFVYLNLGSGVGGGLLLNGQVYRGADGFAGEIGHVKVVPHGRKCRCGGLGCLSAYVCEPNLIERLNEIGISAGSVEDLISLGLAGDDRVRALMEETGTILGTALANLANTLNPSLIILGGRVSALLPLMKVHLQQAFDEGTLGALRVNCEVVQSTLTGDVAALGATALALEGFSSFSGGEGATAK